MADDADILARRCRLVGEVSGEAIEWTGETRGRSERLDREADALIERLRRNRNLCRRLEAAASRPVSVGFFGASQAGKSYLISAVAANAEGNLRSRFDGEVLDFIRHVNPPGGGKEATGIVTRFTRRPTRAPAGFPVEVLMLTEGDVVKVLGNSFQSDFDREKAELAPTLEAARAHVAGFEGRAQPEPTGGLDEDAMVDLQDYFTGRFVRTLKVLEADFWPTARWLVPRLKAEDRAQFLAILWARLEPLTRTYLELRNALASLGHPSAVCCRLDALVKRGDSDAWSQADGIVNVDMLDRLGRDAGDQVALVPVGADGSHGPEAALPRSAIAALAAELTFVLADQPRAGFLDRVDLLDFPGYRGRLKLGRLEDVAAQVQNAKSPVAELFLRGKVAYLFERYTNDREMNVLVLCTGADQQLNINDLGPAITAWVRATQGADGRERAGSLPGLVWALTRFDTRLSYKSSQTVDNLRIEWNGMMQMAMLDKFGGHDWLTDWSGGQPFRNVHLMRKPGLARDLIRVTGEDREVEFIADQHEQLARKRETFLASELVQRHIGEPADAWDAVLELNDGGMTRLAALLDRTASLDVKLGRIRSEVDAVAKALVDRDLGPYFRGEGSAETERKRAKAQALVKALAPRAALIGDLINCLFPPPEHLRGLYLHVEASPGAEAPSGPGAAAASTAPAGGPEASDPVNSPFSGGLISLDLDAEPAPEAASTAAAKPSPRPAVAPAARRFARAVMRDWIKQLRAMPGDEHARRYFGASEGDIATLTDELVTAAHRLRLEDVLADRLGRAEAIAGVSQSRLVERQVLVAQLAVSDFVVHCGLALGRDDDRPANARISGRKAFDPPARFDGLPKLPDQPHRYFAVAIFDWFAAFERMGIDNVGHAAGHDIPHEANARLGGILARLEPAA